jgi:hypothetical protein
LHLRYYVEALRYARFPHAFHAIGSSMAVRAETYLKQGGMNKRQAGEDFYFLHKVIPLGNFGEVNTTRIIASPRPSERVPFGTGRAVREVLESGNLTSYPVEAFDDLRLLFELIPQFYESNEFLLDSVPKTLAEFLEVQYGRSQVEEIRRHTASAASFQKRFFRWFNGFLAMKYIHFARDAAYGSSDVVSAANMIYNRRAGVNRSSLDARQLLFDYRSWQRNSIWAGVDSGNESAVCPDQAPGPRS